jgi:uncharacterized protein (DUF1800 family)
MNSPQTTIDFQNGRRRFLKRAALAGSISSVALIENDQMAAASPSVEGMRSPPTKRVSASQPADEQVGSQSLNTLPPLGVIVLNRMGFGPRPGDLEKFQALGSDDDARLPAYVDEQLNPASINDSELVARLQQSRFETLNMDAGTLWDAHVADRSSAVNRLRPFLEMERAVFTRALYGRRQLVEVLADFWHMHFSVYGRDNWAGPMWVQYDRDVIRKHMLGNFRQMLEAVATSIPMLYFLDNYTNTNAGPNENYARELFELHGLGAENYLGVMRQHEVPRDQNGVPVGYVDDDVYEATRCFTGWTSDTVFGEFRYTADLHDRFQKQVLGNFIGADQPPMNDGRDVFDMIAAHPGTARYIARRLCRRFIADDPPQRVVYAAATVFTARKDAPDQLKQVVRTILLSEEFRTTWGQKVKRPFELVVSSMRAVNMNFNFTVNDNASNWFISAFARTGQPPFQWSTPDGYPDTKAPWLGNNSLIMSWNLLKGLCDMKNWWNKEFPGLDAAFESPPNARSARALADFWIQRVLGRAMKPEDRDQIVDFMARGRNPEMDLPIDHDELFSERLQGMVALIMMSPDNLMR